MTIMITYSPRSWSLLSSVISSPHICSSTLGKHTHHHNLHIFIYILHHQDYNSYVYLRGKVDGNTKLDDHYHSKEDLVTLCQPKQRRVKTNAHHLGIQFVLRSCLYQFSLKPPSYILMAEVEKRQECNQADNRWAIDNFSKISPGTAKL